MKVKCIFIFSFFILFLTGSLYSFETEDEESALTDFMTFSISSGIEYPVEIDYDLLTLGITARLNGGIELPFLDGLQAKVLLSYSYLPVRAENSLSMLSADAGLGYYYYFFPRLKFEVTAAGGGYYGFFNSIAYDDEGGAYENQQGGSAHLDIGAKLSLFLSPLFSIGLNAGYFNYFGFTHGVNVSLSGSLHLEGLKQQVYLENTRFDNLFPSLYNNYDTLPVGITTIVNEERFPLEDVSVSIFIEQYMDNPKVSEVAVPVEAGDSCKLDLTALLSNNVLSLSETSRVTAEVQVEYLLNGVVQRKTGYETITIQNRNALTWDDDMKAASFVTPMSPSILQFSKSTAAMVGEKGPAGINRNLRMAMALFNSLSEYGLGYVIDPNTQPYEDIKKNSHYIDFLQYPVETLEYRGGDCDDLSVLYCSLLESVGVESAFILVPGHIFTAASLAMTPKEAKRLLTNTDDLIYLDDNVWLPIETTLTSESFLKAWQLGASQWREHSVNGNAVLLPLKTCWAVYEASGEPDHEVLTKMPDISDVSKIYEQEIASFVDREMTPRINFLKRKISGSGDNRYRNQLGILYARYGQMEKAEQEFLSVIEASDYLPSLINLGNIYFYKGQLDDALVVFKKAEAGDQNNPVTMLRLAMINYELDNYALANSYYSLAVRLRPDFNEQFAYLSSKSLKTDSRADEVTGDSKKIFWDYGEENDEED